MKYNHNFTLNKTYNLHCLDGLKQLDSNSIDMTLTGVRIVLDKEKILREGKYRLDDLYAYLDNIAKDNIAKKAKLHKQDKFTYYADKNEEDISHLAIFTLNYAIDNEAITRNVKEWYWLRDNVIMTNVIESAKREGDGVWE